MADHLQEVEEIQQKENMNKNNSLVILATHRLRAALAAAQGTQNFVCDYVGQVPQAKGYGTFATYHVRRQCGSC